MDVSKKLVFSVIITNNTSSIFWRDDTTFENASPECPAKLMPYSSTPVTLEASLPAHLNPAIRQYNMQSLFTFQATYTNYSQTVEFASSLKYFYHSSISPLAPILKLAWEHDAKSIGDIPVLTASSLIKKETQHPYSYSMSATILST